KNGMVAGFLRRLQLAFQISQRVVQNGSALRRAIKTRPSLLLGVLVGVYWPRVIFGNHPLVLRQDVDSEALLGMQMSMGPRTMVDADQQQRRIERHGSEGIGGHAMDFALQVESDDGHSRGKASHRLSEFGWTQAHA